MLNPIDGRSSGFSDGGRGLGVIPIIIQLIEAGLLQPDQLMPIRMGLGMGFIATGEDELTSELEVRSNGGVYVNGQRMR